MSEPVTDSTQLPEGAPDDPLTGHDYDGIQEYDNPLPGWWKWLFVASIVFTPPYLFWYHGGAQGRTLADQYDRALAANLELQFKEIGNLTADRENVIKFLYEESWLKMGEVVFRTHCVSCHGRDGGGLVGPNLRDDSYKNVKDIGDILTVLQKGANAGAMPAWGNRLSTNELVLVSSYVASLRGQTLDSGAAKAPEGRVIDPWPGPPQETAVDETAGEASTEPAEEDASTEGAKPEEDAESTAETVESSNS